MIHLTMLTVFGVCLGLFGLGFTRELPEPKFVHLDSGAFELSYENIPGVEFKHIFYGGDQKLDDVDGGTFYQAADNKWYHRNMKAETLKEQKHVFYRVLAVKDGRGIQQSGVISQVSSVAVLPPKRMPKRSHRVVMYDDFSSSSISSANWDYEISMYGGMNGEIQVYTNDHLNCYTKNGNLYLKPVLTTTKFSQHNYLTTGDMDVAKIWGSCTNGAHYGCHREGKYGMLPPIMSCKLKSKHTITYGKIEVRAKIPKGDWIWPAIWMMPRHSHYGGWPRSGEIDIMESRGNTRAVDGNGHNHGVNKVSSTLHWGPDAGHNRFDLTHGSRDNSNLWSSDFHVYSLDWTADHIITYVDGHHILTVNTPSNTFWGKGGFHGSNPWAHGGRNAPFDHSFYLILNVAIGGRNGFFSDSWSYDTHKPWRNSSPNTKADFWNHRSSWLPTWHGDDVAMIIDYVKMEQY